MNADRAEALRKVLEDTRRKFDAAEQVPLAAVETSTGSVYEFCPGYVRRVEFTHDLRRDGEWLLLPAASRPAFGLPLVLVLEPLGDGPVTTRTTSPVVGIDGDLAAAFRGVPELGEFENGIL
ncbi:hypothetical protein JW921_05880 [Candidatus Fermentibacterales bacterium]|nr:hypothetical protein [Candidatus Fermentibacterales bacterium]